MWSNTIIMIDMIVKPSILVRLFLVFDIVAGGVTKQRFCIQFAMDSGRADYDIISTRSGLTKQACMIECVRHVDCMAFNYGHSGGLCEFFPAISACQEPGEAKGFVFFHLGQCEMNFTPCWGSPRLSSQWEALGRSPDTSRLVAMGTRYVSMLFHKGLYLPGWFQSGEELHHIVTPGNYTMATCPDGYFLTFPTPSDYAWIKYTAGDVIPDGAVTGGVWLNGLVLYIIKGTIIKETVSGYYNPATGTASIVVDDVYYITTMHMLVSGQHEPASESIESAQSSLSESIESQSRV